jgi:hypothetical protein
MAVMKRAVMWAKSDAAWKMMVLASSILRALQDERRMGELMEVNVEGGPRRKQRGRADWWHIESKEPKPIVRFGGRLDGEIGEGLSSVEKSCGAVM